MASPRHIACLFASWTCFSVLFVSFWRFVRFISIQNDPLSSVYSGGLISVLSRLFVDCILLSLFFVQHSLMASASWKTFISDRISLHRSIYVVATAVSLQILTYFWCCVPEFFIWKLQSSSSWFFTAIHLVCWVTLYGMNILTDLSELVGLKQAYYVNADLGDPLQYKSEELRSVYAHMRHPSFYCFCVLFFFRPVMTLDRFLFAVSFFFYMVLYFRVDRKDFVYQKRQCKLKWDELWRLM